MEEEEETFAKGEGEQNRLLEELAEEEEVDLVPAQQVDEREHLPLWRIFSLTLCFLGVQFGWAVQIAYTSPIFLELGVPKFGVSFVWLAGPISGLLVQPTVGALSDRNTFRFGRRRPFIVGGTICIILGMLLISNAKDIGRGMGNSPTLAIVIAVVGFWVLDLANNTVQGPCRALLVDVAPVHQQNLGGSFFSFMLGSGNLLGYLIGSFKLTEIFPFFKTDLRALFTIGMIILIICVTVTVIFTPEKPISRSNSTKNPFSSIVFGIWNMPPGMRRICAVQFFSWFAWFNFLLYITTWVGENIFHGDPSAPEGSTDLNLFQEGVRYGALGLTLFAVVTMVCSLLFPIATRFLGLKPVFCFSQLVLATCLFLPLWVQTKVGALILIASFGIPWTAIMVFPFTIVAMTTEESESGLYMGVLNIFVVVPQILVSLGIGFVIEYFEGNLVSALVVGSVSALISAGMVLALIVQKKGPVELSFSGGGH